MTTTTEQLTDAIDAMRALTANREQREDVWEAQLAAAVTLIVLTHKTYYVDAVTGSDAADGTVGAPLLTVQEAINRTPENGSCTINLVNDITLPANFGQISRKQITISGATAPSGRAVITLQSFESGGYAMVSGFIMKGSAPMLAFAHCTIMFPTYVGALAEHPRQSAVASHFQSMDKTIEHIAITNTHLTFPAADGFGYLGSLDNAAIALMGTLITDTNSNMSGRYIRGANVADLTVHMNLITNMTSL